VPSGTRRANSKSRTGSVHPPSRGARPSRHRRGSRRAAPRKSCRAPRAGHVDVGVVRPVHQLREAVRLVVSQNEVGGHRVSARKRPSLSRSDSSARFLCRNWRPGCRSRAMASSRRWSGSRTSGLEKDRTPIVRPSEHRRKQNVPQMPVPSASDARARADRLGRRRSRSARRSAALCRPALRRRIRQRARALDELPDARSAMLQASWKRSSCAASSSWK